MNASVGRPVRLLLSCSLAVALALLVVGVTQGRSLAKAADEVVGPGESIQKAIYAAHPGDTIVVKGVHKEDVVIRKNGIKLRGEDGAVIEAPPTAKADSPCSKAFGTEGVCVLGGVNLENGDFNGSRVSGVGVSGFTFRGFQQTKAGAFAIDAGGIRDATIVGNRFLGNGAGAIIVYTSVDATVAKNHIVANPKATSQAIDVGGDSRNTRVLKNDVRGIAGNSAIVVDKNNVDATIAGNDLEDNFNGMLIFESTGTRILSNDVSHTELVGIYLEGPKRANNAKVVGNDVSGGDFGIFADNSHGGSFVANRVHDTCAGVVFDSGFPKPGPVGDYEVRGNYVTDNTRACPALGEDRVAFSGIGIGLFGAHDMEVSANHLSGNVPSGPSAVGSGGVVVGAGLLFDAKTNVHTKPKDNTVIANHFGRNKPDIYWDKSGSGNSFAANYCDTSVPSTLCK